MNDTILETGSDSKETIFNKLRNYIVKNPFTQPYYDIFSNNGVFKPLDYTNNNEEYYQSNDQKGKEKEEEDKIKVLNDLIKDYVYDHEKHKPSDFREKYGFKDYNQDILKEDEDNSPYFATRDEFVQAILPDILEIAEKYNINPRVMLAQTILETGNGKHIKGNALFGMKGKGQKFKTTEYINGKKVVIEDEFAAYNNLKESMEAYAKYITSNGRYLGTVGKTSAEDVKSVIEFIHSQGYATDPEYSNKIIQIAKEIEKYFK